MERQLCHSPHRHWEEGPVGVPTARGCACQTWHYNPQPSAPEYQKIPPVLTFTQFSTLFSIFSISGPFLLLFHLPFSAQITCS